MFGAVSLCHNARARLLGKIVQTNHYQRQIKAETAIRQRMLFLCEEGNDPEEREALVNAMDTLRRLRRGFSI
jgi:hypothetical protein